MTIDVHIPSEEATSNQSTNLASRTDRLGAYLLDHLILSLFVLPSYIAYAFWDDSTQPYAGVAFMVCVVAFLSLNAHLLAKHSQTVGKRVLGIKIVRRDQRKASFTRLFVFRTILVWLFIAIFHPWSFVDVAFILREEHNCLHDDITDTMVIEVITKSSPVHQ